MAEEYGQSLPPSPGAESYYPSQMYMHKEADQILKTVMENEDLLNMLEHEFRGEVYYTDAEHPDGYWKVVNNPIMTNDDGINTILRTLRLQGLNKVALLTNMSENQIIGNLRTFECKLADLLILKRKEWGIQKDELAMVYHNIWTIVEHALYRAKEGNLLKTIRTVYQHQEYEQLDKTKKGLQLPTFGGSPYK